MTYGPRDWKKILSEQIQKIIRRDRNINWFIDRLKWKKYLDVKNTPTKFSNYKKLYNCYLYYLITYNDWVKNDGSCDWKKHSSNTEKEKRKYYI